MDCQHLWLVCKKSKKESTLATLYTFLTNRPKNERFVENLYSVAKVDYCFWEFYEPRPPVPAILFNSGFMVKQ
jgi:hypothetical protein